MIFKHSLKARTIVFTLLILQAAIWVTVMVISHFLESDMRDLLGRKQQSAAVVIANSINTALEKQLEILEVIADSLGPAVEKSPEIVQKSLEGRKFFLNMFSGVFVTDASGIVLVPGKGFSDLVGASVLASDAVRGSLQKGRTTMGPPVSSASTQAPVLQMAAPIKNGKGEIVGTLVAVIDLTEASIFDALSANAKSDLGQFRVVSKQYRRYVTSSEPVQIGQALPEVGKYPAVDRFVEGYEGTAIFQSPSGPEVMASVAGIRAADWFLGIVLPTEDAYWPIRKLQINILSTAFVMGALAMILLWFNLKRQLQPLADTARLIQGRMQSDAVQEPLPVKYPDEIGSLVKSLNELLCSLRLQAQQLKASELRWQFAIEGVGNGVWDWNSTDDSINLSPVAQRILGLRSGTMTEFMQQLQTRVPVEDWPALERAMKDNRKGKTHQLMHQHRLLPADGAPIRWILARGMVVEHDASGQASRMIGTLSDITQQKADELNLIQARDEAERSSRAKNDLLASVSHELRTPLNAILGFAQILSMESGLSKDQQDMITSIETAGSILLHLVNDLLDMTQIDAGKLQLQVQTMALDQVVPAAIKLVQAMAQAANIELKVSPGPWQSAELELDPYRFQQVLVIFLTNAIKYNHAGGTVEFISQWHEQDGHPMLRIGVRDSGVGIPKEMQGRVFNQFDRMGRENGVIPGTGLGLAIAKQLVEAMGGQIGFESTPGQGSLFWVDFSVQAGHAHK